MTSAVWTLRILATVQAFMTILQPFTAGGFMSGNYGALSMHRMVGDTLSVVAGLAFLAAIYYIVRGGRWRPLVVTLLLTLAIEMQWFWGDSRDLMFHIPVGVLVVGAAVVFAIWTWRPDARRSRHAAQTPEEVPAA